MYLKKKEKEALLVAEEHFLTYFNLTEDEEECGPDTLEGAVEEFKQYLIVKGLLKD